MTTSTEKPPPLYEKFVAGSLGAMAGSAVSHPLDVIKVNLQIQGEQSLRANSPKLGPLSMGLKVFRKDGLRAGLFKGLSASLIRQLVYSGSRFSIYDFISQKARGNNEETLPLAKKVLCGLAAGAAGAFIGNPCDVVLVRMQADSSKPLDQRRNYGNVFNGFKMVVQSEGFSTLYNGVLPTVARAMLVTAAQFASYDQIKEFLVNKVGLNSEAVTTHFAGGILAGFTASIVSNPVDVIKTRLMNMKQGEYKNIFDCVVKTYKNEGLFAFYKGFIPTLARTAPYVVVMFVTVEQVKKGFKAIKKRSLS